MLTEDQKGVIERIPTQGSLSYTDKGKSISVTQDQIDEAVQESFNGKQPPVKKTARIMMGAPGVGKTELARKWLESQYRDVSRGIIFVGYNEGGAENNFMPFMNDIMDAGNAISEKLKIANKYRPVTQKIQNETLKRALHEEFSILVDITAERKGAGFLIDALRGAGYEHIELIGIHARFEIAMPRAEERETRPTDPFDIIDKRTGVLGYYEHHARKCDLFEMHTNNYNSNLLAKKVFAWEPSKIAVDVDFPELARICDDLANDVDSVCTYLKRIKRLPDYKAKIDVEKMMTEYKIAAATAVDFFQRIAATGIGKAPEYSFGK